MPFYEYKCSKCGYFFTELQSIHDEPLTKCPKCGGKLKAIVPKTNTEIEYKNGQEYYERVIKPEAKEIANKIRNGDEDTAADIFGEK